MKGTEMTLSIKEYYVDFDAPIITSIDIDENIIIEYRFAEKYEEKPLRIKISYNTMIAIFNKIYKGDFTDVVTNVPNFIYAVRMAMYDDMYGVSEKITEMWDCMIAAHGPVTIIRIIKDDDGNTIIWEPNH